MMSELFGRLPEFKSVDQPLSPYTASAAHARHLPPFCGGYPFKPTDRDWEQIVSLFDGWRSGSLHYSEPWKLWRSEFSRKTSRIFYKCTSGQAISEKLVTTLPLVGFAFMRHPVPHALSCERLGWTERGGGFLSQSGPAWSLSRKQRNFVLRVDRSGSLFERLLVNWVLENRPILGSTESRIATFYYEDLMLHQERELNAISRLANVDFPPRVVRSLSRASVSSNSKKSGSAVAQTLAAGSPEELIDGWRRSMDSRRWSEAKAVFEELGPLPYNLESSMPTELRKEA